MMTETKKTQTIDQAIAAIEAAGHKAYGAGESVKFYDPRKRGAYCVLESGYCDNEFADYVEAKPSASARKGGPSGEFCAELRDILESNRKSI